MCTRPNIHILWKKSVRGEGQDPKGGQAPAHLSIRVCPACVSYQKLRDCCELVEYLDGRVRQPGATGFEVLESERAR